MPSEDRYEIMGYEITGDIDLPDHGQHYSSTIEQILRQAYLDAQEARPAYLPKLLELIEKYPRVPAFKNYLSAYYQKRDEPDKAFEVNRQLVKEFPDYLHGKINLASEYLVKEQYDKVPEILGEMLDLKALYPRRKVFHFNEFEGFMNVACQYLIATDRLEEAEARIEIIEEILPDTDVTNMLRMQMAAKRLGKMTDHFRQKDIKRQQQPIGRSYDRSIQTDEPPELHHPELQVLYEQGLRIRPEVLRELLALPRETLVEDLKRILWDSVRRYEYFKTEIDLTDWDPECHHFPLHALFLLTELRATDQLPLLLDCLRQGDDYLELWYGDHRFDTLQHFIYHLGGDQLEVLQAFMQEPDIHYTAKNIVSEAVKQISLHQPQRGGEVLDWYEQILRYFLDHLEDALLIDEDAISHLISDLDGLKGAGDLLPLIRQFYDLQLVDKFLIGDYDDLERDILTSKRSSRKMPIYQNIFDHYQHILTTWHGYMTDEEREAQETAWQKRIAEMDSQRSWEPSSFDAPVTTIKRTAPKVGRNDPCPCGSGKKYKKCCWGK